MSTPTRAEVERKRAEARAERVLAEAAGTFLAAIDPISGDLSEWDQGYLTARTEGLLALATRYRELADLHERCVEADHGSREAATHLAALDANDELIELAPGRGRPPTYAGGVRSREELPVPEADNVQEVTRVYAVYEEPMAVAVEGDAEWVFEELP